MNRTILAANFLTLGFQFLMNKDVKFSTRCRRLNVQLTRTHIHPQKSKNNHNKMTKTKKSARLLLRSIQIRLIAVFFALSYLLYSNRVYAPGPVCDCVFLYEFSDVRMLLMVVVVFSAYLLHSNFVNPFI